MREHMKNRNKIKRVIISIVMANHDDDDDTTNILKTNTLLFPNHGIAHRNV